MTTSSHRAKFLSRFPETKDFVDCAGNTRVFNFIWIGTDEDGYHFHATEVTDSLEGYFFEGYSDTNPINAFSETVMKVRKAMSQKFLDPTSEKPSLLHLEAEGRVSSGGVVIDGRFVSFEDLSELIQTHEGWEFSISFKS